MEDDAPWPAPEMCLAVAAMYKRLRECSSAAGGARVEELGDAGVAVDVKWTQTDLKRFQEVQSVERFLVTKEGQAVRLGRLPQEAEGAGVAVQSTSPSGAVSVRFRKGAKDDGELWAEVWRAGWGLVQSAKVSDKVAFVYNDAMFGGIEWSVAEDRVVFVAECPAPKKYKSYFERDKADTTADKADTAADKADTAAEPWYDAKFSSKESFGETLDNKVKPGIFVLDLADASVAQVRLATPTNRVVPQQPRFDAGGGIVFQGLHLAGKKLGLSFCLNKKTALYRIAVPSLVGSAKSNAGELPEAARPVSLTGDGIFLAFNARFCADRSRLAFLGTTKSFQSHSTAYDLFVIEVDESGAPRGPPQLVLASPEGIPSEEDDFGGLYGYQATLTEAGFVGNSRSAFVLQSPSRGRNRVLLVDVDAKTAQALRAPGLDSPAGEYDLVRLRGDVAVVAHSSFNCPQTVYAVLLQDAVAGSARFVELTSVRARLESEPQLSKALLEGVEQRLVRLDNGAEAYLQFSRSAERLPCVVLLHGGPFSASQRDAFLVSRNSFLALGCALLVVNYRGSLGFGTRFLDALVGNIGEMDVQDCGDLVRLAIAQCEDVIDADRIGVYGGSHGGFLTGWLSGHPEYRDMFKAAALWNPVLNLSYNLVSTDIPDWVYACALGREYDGRAVTAEENAEFFRRSPASVAGNVTCPSLLLVGLGDQRVPPHQAEAFYHALKAQGTPVRMFRYPKSGHALAECEHNVDANLNLLIWFAHHLGLEAPAV